MSLLLLLLILLLYSINFWFSFCNFANWYFNFSISLELSFFFFIRILWNSLFKSRIISSKFFIYNLLLLISEFFIFNISIMFLIDKDNSLTLFSCSKITFSNSFLSFSKFLHLIIILSKLFFIFLFSINCFIKLLFNWFSWLSLLFNISLFLFISSINFSFSILYFSNSKFILFLSFWCLVNSFCNKLSCSESFWLFSFISINSFLPVKNKLSFLFSNFILSISAIEVVSFFFEPPSRMSE